MKDCQIGEIGQIFRLVIISPEGSSHKTIKDLACNHGRKEADHELAIAHQEVRVPAEQEIFSAE